jgi:small subunit ribosomal protein S2
MPRASLKQLLLAGSHFGHLTRRWNPKMEKYIFMQKNGIHIIDLKKTQFKLEEACNALQHIVQRGDDVLFVGTKPQSREMIQDEANRVDMFYVEERWLGGMLTNFRTIRNSIRKLDEFDEMEKDGTYEKLNKKEILQVERQKAKLLKVLGGMRKMKRLPGAVFVIDINKESIAVHEAQKLGIPVFAIVDTNADPTTVEYPIPANDDAYKSIALITHVVTDAIEEAKLLRQEKVELEEELKEKQERKQKKAAPASKPARRRRSTKPAGEERPTAAPRDEADEKKPAKKAAAPKEETDEKKPVKKAAAKKDEADEKKPVKKAAAKKDETDEKKPVKKAAAKKDEAGEKEEK